MKKLLFLLLLTLFFIPGVVNAKEVKEELFGYGGNGEDMFNGVAMTSDGGYVAVGHTSSTDIENVNHNGGWSDAIIVKYNKSGEVEWQQNYGGSDIERFESVALASDGGYVAVGYTVSTDIEGITNRGGSNAIIVKYNKSGEVEWQQNYGGSSYDYFESVTIATDGGYVAVGYTESTDIEGITIKGNYDAIIVKYDNEGTLEWQKNYGGSYSDYFESVTLASDGGYVAVGYTNSKDIEGITIKGNYDAIIVKYDEKGTLEWQQNYGGSSYESFDSVALTSDGGYVVAGTTYSNDIGHQDAIIVKYDKNGTLLWQKSYGGSGWDHFNGITSTANDRYIAVGGISSGSKDIEGIVFKGYENDAIIVEYDKNGNIVSQQNYGGSKDLTGEFESFFGVSAMHDNYVAVGTTTANDIDEIPNPLYWYESMIFKKTTIYDITTEETTNGTFEVTQEGYRARIMFTSEKGYELDEIIVTDSKGNKVEYYEEDGNYYVNLTDDIKVNVTFKKETINPDTGVMQVIDILVIIGLIIGGIFYFRKNKNYI